MHELPLLYAFCRETNQDMCDFSEKTYGDVIYDFSAGNMEVAAGNSKVIEEVYKMIQKQKKVNERLSNIIIRSMNGNPGEGGDRER